MRRAACHVAEAEWRVAGWLERQGIAHDVYAETQLDDGTLDLDEYKVLMITCHPEYWTRPMYHKVSQGLHLRSLWGIPTAAVSRWRAAAASPTRSKDGSLSAAAS